MRLGQEERMMAADVVSLSRDLRDRLLEERLRVVEATRGRFQGRRALEKKAQNVHIDYRERACALANLELRLGLIDEIERDERIVQAYLDDETISPEIRAFADALKRDAISDDVAYPAEIALIRVMLVRAIRKRLAGR
jgi:hypothetical protein